MKHIIYIILIAAMLFHFSCDCKKTSNYRLIPSEYSSFDMPEGSLYPKFHNSFYQNKSQWIVFRVLPPDSPYGSLALVYYRQDSSNLTRWHYSHTIQLPEFNNHKVFDMFTNNVDSVFVSPYNGFEVKVVYADTARKSYTCYVDTAQQTNESEYRNQILIVDDVRNWMFYNDALYTILYHNDLISETFAELMEENFKLPLYGKFVNKNGVFELEKTFGRWSEFYRTNFCGGLGDRDASMVTDSQYLYTTFRHDHNVYIYDDTMLIAKKPMQSPNVKKLVGMDYESNPTEMATYWITNDRYGRFYYDPYRQLFYRQAMYPSPEYLKENSKLRQLLQNWDLLIFDKEMNYVGKHYFIGDRHLSFIAVLPEGLLVQCYGNENVKMQLFKVEKK
ncbi:MAG: DUF4221 domain-containing protein [Lentimicrobiaceae bacterium]|jgi:hypothetical protein|nr:DUF4221 domain-containing protein [Lentimicrobiaceae bacterium]